MSILKKLSVLIILTIAFFKPTSLNQIYAAIPIGSLDTANGSIIKGWAYDPDYNNPISIHIYVDGKLVHNQLANEYRANIDKNAGFSWSHSPFGSGNHTVTVYAIGIDSNGAIDNQNPALNQKSFNVGCSGLLNNELEWCNNNPNYWVNRQADTKLIWNDYIKIGINNSYGGLITQLYSQNRSINLIEEHGGSAVQISLYGYDQSNGSDARWFQKGGCYPTAHLTKQACENVAGTNNCSIRPAGLGQHVADCINVNVCNPQLADAGWPFNPIQAQGINCSWDHPSNDVQTSEATTNGWKIIHNNLNNYSKSSEFTTMTVEQTVTLNDVYAKIDYTLTYNGSFSQIGSHPQEIPAFFTSEKNNFYFYFYSGNNPYQDFHSPVTKVQLTNGFDEFLALPNYQSWPSDNPNTTPYAHATERWWGTCDDTQTNCVTLAIFDNIASRAAMKKTKGAYITPLGYFAITPGMNHQFSLYVFPYKWDKLINGKTIRQRIFELNPTPPNATPSPSPTPANTPGDATNDGFVDILDIKAIIQNFNQTQTGNIDVNDDGIINILDFNIVANNYENK